MADTPAEVLEYDPSWPARFGQVRDAVAAALVGFEHDVEHIGSTSVRGLAAKPILDVLVVLDPVTRASDAIAALAEHGWRHDGDGGIHGRERFHARADLPYHHLYLVERRTAQHLDPLRFRDALRGDPSLAAEYDALKRSLAPLLLVDRAGYTEGKTAFVRRVLSS